MTARDTGERFARRGDVPFDGIPDFTAPGVIVDDRVQYQTIEGFGGAFTEAAAVTLAQMPEEKQEEILRAYFDPNTGMGYTLCRTHINSCDFSLGNYAYDEVADDTSLEHFSIDRDRQALIPMIKRAMSIAYGSIKLFASPWSPPAWMKTNARMNNGGRLRPEYRDAWARYFAKYIHAYGAERIPIWGVTVQNEPDAIQPWDSCNYSAEEERDFVRDHLGPTLAREGLRDTKIIVWDHNRDLLFQRAKVMLDDPAAARYVWGVGFHWYCGDNFDNVQLVHDAYPETHLLLTEGCQEGGPHIGEWAQGERYGRSIVQDLNHWAVGWVDWNLLLNEKGGPNHVGNYCSAPIIGDTSTGEVLYQSSYYYLGHFAKFIRPGAHRILCSTNRDELEATAAVNPDGSTCVVAMNRSDEPIPFQVFRGANAARVSLPAHAIITLQWYNQYKC